MKVFVLLYKEMEAAVGLDSFLTKQALTKLHPNIKVPLRRHIQINTLHSCLVFFQSSIVWLFHDPNILHGNHPKAMYNKVSC